MGSELVVVLRCDHFDFIQGRAVYCKGIVVVKECAIFVDQREYSGEPYAALDYITPEGWYRAKGREHYCPVHAKAKINQKYSLPLQSNMDSMEPVEEPTRKIKLPDVPKRDEKNS